MHQNGGKLVSNFQGIRKEGEKQEQQQPCRAESDWKDPIKTLNTTGEGAAFVKMMLVDFY